MNNENRKFTNYQSAIIRNSLTLLAFSFVAFFCIFVVYGILSFIGKYQTVFFPLITGIVLALILKPLYNKLYRWFFIKHLPKKYRHFLPLIILFTIITIPLCSIIYFFGDFAIDQLSKAIQSLPQLYEWGRKMFTEKAPAIVSFCDTYGITEYISSLDPQKIISSTTSTKILSGIGHTAFSISSYVQHIIGNIIAWFTLPIYTALFLVTPQISGSYISDCLVFVKSEKAKNNVSFLIDQFLDILVQFFRGQVLVAFFQGVMFSILFQIIGLKFGIIFGLVLGFLNIFPYLGNFLGLSVILPFALFSSGGSIKLVLLVICSFCIVQTLDSFFITPKIMGNRTGLSSATIIFSLIFWGTVIPGSIGVLLAIPLSAFIAIFIRLLKKEYFSDEELIENSSKK